MPSFTFQTRLPLPETGQELQDRLKALFAIQDELAREIETLIGKKVDFEPGKPWHCLRCDHQWLSRLPHRPRLCPACKTKKFDSQPTYTYEERMRLRQSKVPVKTVPAPSVQPLASSPLPHSVLTRPADPIALTPPPVAPSTGMSLRERLALINSTAGLRVTDSESEATRLSHAQVAGSNPVPAPLSEDDLIEVINGEPDAT